MRIGLPGLLVLLTLALASSGCMGGGNKALSQEEAEARVTAALEGLPGTFTSDPASDDLRKVTMETDGASSGAGGMTLGEGTLLIEWGRGDVVHVEVNSAQGPVTVALELYCGPDGVVMIFGGESYATRPSVEEDPCSDLEGDDESDEEADVGGDDFGEDFGDEGPEGLGDFFDWESLDAGEADVTPHEDGTVTAVFTDPTGTTTVALDAKGRLTRLVFEGEGTSEDASATMDLEYGSRRTIDIPAADHLVPATLEADEEFEAATHSLAVEVTRSPEEPPLDEMEVRVLDGPGGETLAEFPLDLASATSAGIEFHFTDADDDGKLSAGDSYTLASSGWDSAFDVDHVVWDVAAEGEVNSTPLGMPGLGVAALAVALLVAGLAARRLA